MGLLMKLRNLFLVGLVIGLVVAAAPVQPINAGEYVEYEGEDGYAAPDIDFSYDYYWIDVKEEYGTANYDTDSLYTHCDVYAWTWVRVNLISYADADADMMYTYASAWKYWYWQGGGTPTGGTLEFNYTVDGGNDASGYAGKSGTSAYAYSSASGSSSAGGEATSYAPTGVSSACGGNTYDSGMGYTTTTLTPSEAGYTDEGSSIGSYGAETSWYLYVDDEVEIPSDTSIAVFLLHSTCTQASSGCHAGVNLNEGHMAEAFGSATCYATASGSASFE